MQSVGSNADISAVIVLYNIYGCMKVLTFYSINSIKLILEYQCT